jgi:hypothetical protein
MKLFELFSKPASTDNLKRIAEAVKNKTSAKVKLGETVYVINYNSASAVYDLYETARVNGNSQRFIQELETPGVLIKENTETLDHILNRFPKEVKDFQTSHVLNDDLYHALFDYYLDHGEMPYGVAKARDGDPAAWVADRLDQEIGHSHDADVPVQMPESDPVLAQMEDLFSGDEDEQPMPELITKSGMFESKKAKGKPDFLDVDKDGDKKEPMKKALKDKETVEEGWDDMIKAVEKRNKEEKGTGKFDKKTISTGTVYTRKYDANTGETEDAPTDGEGNEPAKRGRGRPRKHPKPDPNAPKRGRGRPKKVREWIENLRYISEGC